MTIVRLVVVMATWFAAMVALDLFILNVWTRPWWKVRFPTNGFAISASTKNILLGEKARLTVLTRFLTALRARIRVRFTCPRKSVSISRGLRLVPKENMRKLFLQNQSKGLGKSHFMNTPLTLTQE